MTGTQFLRLHIAPLINTNDTVKFKLTTVNLILLQGVKTLCSRYLSSQHGMVTYHDVTRAQ